jgi:hypothetical protein
LKEAALNMATDADQEQMRSNHITIKNDGEPTHQDARVRLSQNDGEVTFHSTIKCTLIFPFMSITLRPGRNKDVSIVGEVGGGTHYHVLCPSGCASDGGPAEDPTAKRPRLGPYTITIES